MIDTGKRSFIKAFTWRLVAVFLLGLVTFSITSDWKTVTYVTAAYHIIQIGLYFLHERIWSYIMWGKTKGLFIQMTGMSGAGKTTLAMALSKRLNKRGFKVEVIDGDEYRKNLCKDLGFSKEDRNENIRRLSFVGKVLGRNGVVCLMSAINPYDSVRQEIKESNKESKLVYVKCDIDTLKGRDPKGLYKKALLPDGHPEKIYNFTGISDPFENPKSADLVLDTSVSTVQESLDQLEDFVLKNVR